jgi:hypothetical protein
MLSSTEHTYRVSLDWLPTTEAIMALPYPLRKYIHDLHTNADPAGMIRENWFLRAQRNALIAKVAELEGETS